MFEKRKKDDGRGTRWSSLNFEATTAPVDVLAVAANIRHDGDGCADAPISRIREALHKVRRLELHFELSSSTLELPQSWLFCD